MTGPMALAGERHRDACDAGRVAWEWIDALAVELAAVEDRALLEITTFPRDPQAEPHSSIEAVVLSRRGLAFAMAVMVRDDANFTQLIRWQAGPVA